MFSLFLTLLATQTIESHDAFTSYVNTKKGYSIEYPIDWTINDQIEGFDLFLAAPKKDEKSVANVSIISGPLPKGITLDDYTRENIKNLLTGNKTIKIKDSGVKELAGTQAFWIRYTREDHHTEIVHYFFIIDGTAYLITAGAHEPAFERYQPIFDKIVESFHIQKTPS